MKWFLPAIGCALLAGCANSSKPSSGDVSKKDVIVRPIHPTVRDTVVRRTHLPIDYMISGKRIVHVNDLTTNQQLWKKPVKGNTHLRVSTTGIQVNERKVYHGKLKNGDVYEIVLVPNGF